MYIARSDSLLWLITTSHKPWNLVYRHLVITLMKNISGLSDLVLVLLVYFRYHSYFWTKMLHTCTYHIPAHTMFFKLFNYCIRPRHLTPSWITNRLTNMNWSFGISHKRLNDYPSLSACLQSNRFWLRDGRGYHYNFQGVLAS